MSDDEYSIIPFRDAGRGVPVLLLHGLPFEDSWDEVASLLVARWRVITCHLRGHGLAAEMDGPYNIPTHAADAVRLLDAAAIERAIVVGHSFGGHVALQMLRCAPGRLIGVVVVAAEIGADAAAVRAARERIADGIAVQNRMVADDDLMGLLFPPYVLRERRDLLERWRPAVARASPQMVAEALRSVACRPDARELVATSETPVAALLGALDAGTDAASVARDVPGRTVLLPDVGHMLPVESPHDTARALEGLFASMLGA